MVSVSVCMIVKNEEKVLERCLESLRGLYEELVIVDTGSDDNTIDIASKYTSNVYTFEWVNDFSKARNFAFSKCTMDYIYSVDADEVIDAVNRQRFLDLKSNLLSEIEIVQMWYLNSKEFVTTENFDRELRPKLYKRLREFKWIDPVHESVNLNPVVYDSDIEILHMPISSHSKRDFSVFLDAISKEEFISNKLHKMYARELMLSGKMEDFENAKDFFLQSVYDERRTDEQRNDSYIVLTKYYRMCKNVAEMFKWALKNICINPCSDICYEIGLYYYELDDCDEALIWFENAVNETKPLISLECAGKLSYTKMADCYRKLACSNEALADYFNEQAEKYAEMCI